MSESFVYFIKPVGMEGPIKIGCSETPMHRLKQLMSWSPFELELIATTPGDATLERNLHDVFAKCHLHGEWFDPSIAMREAIAKVKAGVPIAEAVDLTKPSGNIRRNRLRNMAPDTRERLNYLAKINGRLRGFNKRLDTWLLMPADISEIFEVWGGHYRQPGSGVRPSQADFAKIDAFIDGLPDTAVPSLPWLKAHGRAS